MVKALTAHVDGTFRTIARREGRAINGLSMGGFGAMMIGLRHPDMFASVGSRSGASGFARSRRSGRQMPKPREASDRPNPAIGLPDFDSQLERTPKGEL